MSEQSGNKGQHFVPVTYLKKFTATDEKDGKLFVIDLQRDKTFESTPQKVAKKNLYYRLKNDKNLEPDHVDKILDKNLVHLNGLIEKIIQFKEIPPGKDIFNNMEMQIALMMARNPESRYNSKLVHEAMIKEHLKTKMEDAPQLLKDDVAARGIYNGINIDFDEDYFIKTVLHAASAYYTPLKTRSWIVVEAPDEDFFITSDSPVTIKNISKEIKPPASLINRYSQVFFPISKKFGLVGVFDPVPPRYILLNKKGVASFNTQTMEKCSAQIYSSSENFLWFDYSGNIGDRRTLLEWRKRPDISGAYGKLAEYKREDKLDSFRSIYLERYDPVTLKKLE